MLEAVKLIIDMDNPKKVPAGMPANLISGE
jgi:hypothetical protein